MVADEGLDQLDPAARAVAEVRAREAGVTTRVWLADLVFKAAATVRPVTFYGGGPPVEIKRANTFHGGSHALSTTLASHYDLDVWSMAPEAHDPAWGKTIRVDVSTPDHVETLVEDATRSALRMISLFPSRIDYAAILLSAAFAEGAVSDFKLPTRRAPRAVANTGHWYRSVIHTCLDRSREVRNALVHDWTPVGRAERLWTDAFVALSDLTPAGQDLIRLCLHDRVRASAELAKHLDLVTQQFELSANLVADLEASAPVEPSEAQRFAELRAALLARAGGGQSLTECATALGISRQALHKRIKAGKALGLMNDGEIVLPRLQWLEEGEGLVVLPGVADLLALFDAAGGWSALQFLLDVDPNLGVAPIQALRDNQTRAVIAAARAYLGADEE